MTRRRQIGRSLRPRGRRMARGGRSARLVGLAVAGLVASGLVATVTAHAPDPILGGGLYPQNEVLVYRWSGSGTPPSAMRTAIKAGVDDANGSRQSKAPSFAYDSGAGNVVYYGTDVPCGVNGLACMRRDTPDWFGVWYRENGHRFDWGTLRWCEMTGSPDGCFEARNVMLHELGHVMILDHHENWADDRDAADAVVQTYQRAKPRAGWNTHAFARCDVATLQQQYDVASSTTLYSTCLSVPTTLSLTASATSVPTGSTVTFSATLRSDGTGRLSNNGVSSRTIVLQQRTSSGWSDLVTMKPGSTSGSYAASVTVTAQRDFRALFRKPSNEGLQSSSSAAITVSVTVTPPPPTCRQALCPQEIPGQ